MKWFDKLCTLALRKLIERNKENLVLSGQQEFYNTGFEHGQRLGVAFGERLGAQRMCDAMEVSVRQRHGLEVEQEDIDSARRGGLH